MTYHDELCKAMVMLSEHPRAIFMGQGVGAPGTSMHSTLKDVPRAKRLEMPVAEELQMGMVIGMALEGWLPICIFPRWNFMLRAADQLVNHLDRLPIYSGGEFKPKVIIRTAVPSTSPFNPGPQHGDDFADAFHTMCRTIQFRDLVRAEMIVPAYQAALASDAPMILSEFTDLYRNERAKEMNK